MNVSLWALTVEACIRNSYSSLSSPINSSDTRAMDGQLLSGLFLFKVNLGGGGITTVSLDLLKILLGQKRPKTVTGN